ncbi:MAG: 4-hydroxy-3-methylbut-2-enyl diphosphate reductase [Bacteroidales bacterium]|nr:4-hydroxy-3-methylbut-2-enyl diphosphate reductase [Bacteroidales bacterium]
MRLTIEIDEESGFCYGVIRAVQKAEMKLKESSTLYSLGSIVHNNSELDRLNKIGLEVIDLEQMKNLSDTTVLIRAHGEPPRTYEIARENNISLIDCTCPVVLKLQARIRETYASHNGQIVIFGKIGHAEVNGLVGQANGDAIVVDGVQSLEKIDFTKPICIFSQTTKDPKEYEEICEAIKERIVACGGPVGEFQIHNTICRQVAQRHTNLVAFAESHSVIVFISGKESSNGKVLYDLCKSVNPRSYHIQTRNQIDPQWFQDGDSVGICGATSTPKWQLEGVAKHLEQI